MNQVIYLDILIIVNLFINYFLLIATAKFLNIQINKLRVLAGATLGAIYSLYILFQSNNEIFSFLIKLFMAFTIILASFYFPSLKIYIKAVVCFFSISFGFSGAMLALWFAVKPNGLLVKNGVVYFNISPIVLILSTTVVYFVLDVIGKFLGKRENKDSFCKVEIGLFQEKICLNLKIDTGNTLKEPFSGLPVVIVCDKLLENKIQTKFREISSLNNQKQENSLGGVKCETYSHVRLIPFSTITSSGLLTAFKADYISIEGDNIKRDAYVAICPEKFLNGDFEGLISPDLIN